MVDTALYLMITKRFGHELAEILLTYLDSLQGNSFKASNVASFHFQSRKTPMSKVEREQLTKQRAQLSSKLYFFLKELEKHEMGVEFTERTSSGSWFRFDREKVNRSLKTIISTAETSGSTNS